MFKRLFLAGTLLMALPWQGSAQTCVDITERMSDGSASQRAAITARIKELRDEGRDVYVTAKSTYSTIHAVCKLVVTPPPPPPPPPPPALCADGLDNDGDGLIDLADPGCADAADNDEFNAAPPPPPPPTGNPSFLDTFDYVVGRSDTNAPQLFLSHGWNQVKTSQTASGARGFIYTTDTVPNYTGPFPGGGSRVLATELLPETLGGQTDAYLGLENIPGDVWFQFWIYVAGDSRFGCREKFFYLSGDGAYPSHTHKWMLMAGACAYDANSSLPLGFPTTGQFLFATRNADGVSTIVNTQGDPNAPGNMGQSDLTQWVRPNTWTLVKMNFNTTATTGNSWRAWIRNMDGQFVQIANHVGGQNGLTWDVPAAYVGGHRVLRLWTTVDYNKRVYFDDFAMATRESDLPTYAR